QLTQPQQAVQDDSGATAELSGGDVGLVRPARRIEHVVGHVQRQMDARAPDQRQDGQPPVPRAVEGGHRDSQPDRDDGGRQERQAGGAEEQPPGRQLWLDRTPELFGKALHVALGLRHPPLRELEEGHLLLVPVLDPCRSELELAVGPAERSPERDVAAFVVSLSGLGADVAEHHVDLAALRRPHIVASDPIQQNDALIRNGFEARGDRERVPVLVDERDDRMRVVLAQAPQEPRGSSFGGHRAPPPAVASSNTCGAWSVRPSSHRKARRGRISMIPRSKNRGSATRLPRKKSMAGSFFRHIGRTLVSHPEWRSASSTVASPWMVARLNRSTSTAMGSVIESETFGLALMCSS